MKVYIEENGRAFSVPVPLSLVQGITGLIPRRVFLKAQQSREEDPKAMLSKKDIQYLLSEFAAVAREYRGLEIVHVESGNENKEVVSIVL